MRSHLKPATMAREINRSQAELNHPDGLKTLCLGGQTHPTRPIPPASGAAPANPKMSGTMNMRYHAGFPGSSRLRHTPFHVERGNP